MEARRGEAGAVIVDQHVEAPEMFYRRLDHRVALLGLAHIGRGHFAGPAGFADLIADFFEVFDFAARDYHLGAARAEFLGDRFPDAGSAAGHDGHFVFDADWV